MPPRPHAFILTTLALACALVALLIAPRPAWPSGPQGAAPRDARSAWPSGPRSEVAPTAPPPAVTWRWPLRGRVVGTFRLTPRAPFARGQRRGIDVAAARGIAVRAVCPGRVVFAGPVPGHGLVVTVRCGALVATYLRLGRLAVRAGARVAPGERLGALGPSGLLRLGARRAVDRRGYIDPLALLRDPGTSAPPALGPAPRGRRPRVAPAPPRPRFAAPRPRAGEHRLPWPAYPALAVIATAFPVGGLIHHRRRRRAGVPVVAAHEGP